MSVAMKAPEIDGPRVSGALEVAASTCTRPMTVPMMPIVGAKPPAVSNTSAPSLWRVRHGVDLDLEDLAHEVRIGAVDDELHALAW